MIEIYIGLMLIAFFAHIIKGLTGFGPAIIFVSLGSLIHNPIEVIIIAALLDIVGGTYLSSLNPHFFDNKKYWIPMSIFMVIGAIIGSISLYFISSGIFEYILGISIIIIAIWFIFSKNTPSGTNTKLNYKDKSVGIFSGFCGGFTGMGGPPLIVYLGSKLKKDIFRAVIVPIFLLSAIARFSTYGILGMWDTTNIYLYILPPIGVIAGNYIGNNLFNKVNQRYFTILIGIILLFSGIQLLY